MATRASTHTEEFDWFCKVGKRELEKRCQQLQKEREEMWERLGMDWQKGNGGPYG